MPKHTGAIIPDPIDPPGTRRVVVCVPDTVEWLSLFTGCVAQMTFGWYWDRTTGDLDAVRERAKRMYFEMQEQNGLCDVLDCDEVAECIETSSAVRAAINNIFQENIQNGAEIPQDVLEQPLYDGSGECDLDQLWGMVSNIVIVANRQIIDLLETVEAITNNQEALSVVIRAIPLVGALPVDELIEIVNKIREWLKEAYEAGYDLDIETRFKCELFCLARDECILTAEQVRDYFWGQANSIPGFGVDAFQDARTLITALAGWEETIGETVVEVMFASAFGFQTFVNSLFGLDFGFFKMEANVGIPDDDWYVLCECVGEWVFTIDLTVENGGFTAISNSALWTSGQGWGVNTPVNSNTVVMQLELPPGDYTEVQFEADVAPAYTSLVALRTDAYPAGTVIAQQQEFPGQAITTLTHTAADPAYVLVNYSKTSSNPFSGYIGKLTRVTFRGTGDNPFE